MIEIWKDITGYYGIYQVSDFGNIKALPKHINYIDGRVRFYPEKILKPRLDGKGYCFVTLHKDDTKEQLRVHRVVAIEFLENTENKPCVNHKDSNRTNNMVDNLEWVTHSENTIHAISTGRIYNPSKKITKEDSLKIKELYKTSKYTQSELGELFGLKQPQIHRIVTNKNWTI